MKFKIKLNRRNTVLLSMALCALVFASSYMISYFYNRKKTYNPVMVMDEDKQSILLDDDYKIVLTKRTISDDVVVENTINVKDIKKELHVNELNVEQVVGIYKEKGYNVFSTDDYQMVFERSVGSLQPNKYYIGDKDGYIAIYKSDINGIPVIEDENDITEKSVDSLMEIDKSMIRNYEMIFDTKEDCEEALSNFIS